ncbi:MAG: hypothetical protein JWM56_943 [Candidatus Peribacteria bacterium]|nr:hypothetical protein [Candidatus Peribacteria bacterium]
MITRFIAVSFAVVLVTGCASVAEKQARTNAMLGDITQKANELTDTVKKTAADTAEIAKKGVETAKDIKQRADKVANGVKQVQQGLAGE